MLQIRPAEERGHSKLRWLDSHFTFSFDQYHDPRHMHFRSLRVINEDVIAPAQGFPMHAHRDMEILTWVLDGALEHAPDVLHALAAPLMELLLAIRLTFVPSYLYKEPD